MPQLIVEHASCAVRRAAHNAHHKRLHRCNRCQRAHSTALALWALLGIVRKAGAGPLYCANAKVDSLYSSTNGRVALVALDTVLSDRMRHHRQAAKAFGR